MEMQRYYSKRAAEYEQIYQKPERQHEQEHQSFHRLLLEEVIAVRSARRGHTHVQPPGPADDRGPRRGVVADAVHASIGDASRGVVARHPDRLVGADALAPAK